MFKHKKKDKTPAVPPPPPPAPTAPLVAASDIEGAKEIIPLYAYRKVVENPEPKYIVFEPPLSKKEADLIKQIKEFLYEETEYNFSTEKTKDKSSVIKLLRGEIWNVILRHNLPTDSVTFNKACYYITRDFLGFGRLDPLMHDPAIEDISVSGYSVPAHVILRGHRYFPTNIAYDEKDADDEILRLAYRTGRHISVAQPILDAQLPGGSRIQLAYRKEVSARGSLIQVRKFREDPFTIVDLANIGTLSSEIAAYLWFAIEHRASILVCGGTGAGKTSTLNVLCMFIQPSLKIVTIEDTQEIRLFHENLTNFVSRVGFGARAEERGDISLFELLRASLRQSPDYIIVGEIRGEEAYVLMQAIATGHGGLTSIHGDTVEAIINRLVSPPMNIPKEQVAECIDLYMIQNIAVLPDNSVVRRCAQVSETAGFDLNTREIINRELFRWNPIEDTISGLTAGSTYLEKVSKRTGVPTDELLKEVRRRDTVIKWMAQRGRENESERNYRTVTNLIKQYYRDPEGVYEQAVRELKDENIQT